jgi:hypothetical protein
MLGIVVTVKILKKLSNKWKSTKVLKSWLSNCKDSRAKINISLPN